LHECDLTHSKIQFFKVENILKSYYSVNRFW